jgi:hypothetical protein
VIIWKEVVLPLVNVCYPCVYLEKSKKTTKSVSEDSPLPNRTQVLNRSKVTLYRWTEKLSLLGKILLNLHNTHSGLSGLNLETNFGHLIFIPVESRGIATQRLSYTVILYKYMKCEWLYLLSFVLMSSFL